MSSKLKFSDGVEFDLAGQYRLTHRSDGWYVVGAGLLMPVNDPEEGRKVMAEMTELDKLKRHKQK